MHATACALATALFLGLGACRAAPTDPGELADALEFDGPARHRGPGELATTVAADLRIDAGRSDGQVLLLRAAPLPAPAPGVR